MRAARGGIPVLATVLAALAGCAGCDSVPDEAITDCDQQVVPGGAATDILFVIDDSGSMSEEQEELAANLGQFISALVNAPVRLDLRIGVTNTSIDRGGIGPGPGEYGTSTAYGDPSNGVPFPGVAGTPYPAGAMVAIEQGALGGRPGDFLWGPEYGTPSTWGGPRILASGPDLVRDFRANALQGMWGSGKEQPLEAMKRALDQSAFGGLNYGFQRAGARLAVVVLTDEDDCSSDPGAVISDADCHANQGKLNQLGDYVSYLGSAAFSDAGPPIFALIAGYNAQGTIPKVCHGWDAEFPSSTSTAAAAAPNRLDEFVDLLDSGAAGRTLRKSICGSYGSSLLAIASMIIPQTVPLDQAPEDYRMLTVALDRGGTLLSCPVALEGSAGPGTGAVFVPPQPGSPAMLRFQGPCVLGIGDRVEIGIICAR